jgi:hypothetical protein
MVINKFISMNLWEQIIVLKELSEQEIARLINSCSSEQELLIIDKALRQWGIVRRREMRQQALSGAEGGTND